MIRVQAPARLHFGLFHVGSADPAATDRGALIPIRQFGGAGLMIEEPGVRLALEPAAEWRAAGPHAPRALEIAHRFAASLPPGSLPPHQITVEEAPDAHVGLGSGTQLSLAIARALATAAGCPNMDVLDLATRTGRGRRSGIGVHGFERGGFLIDAGKLHEPVAPLLVHRDFPDDWRIVLMRLTTATSWHGDREMQAFQRLAQMSDSDLIDRQSRLALLGMVPALDAGDCESFAEAVYEFNVNTGTMFAPAQGGLYADAVIAELVEFLWAGHRRRAAQSSWGPTVFSIVSDPDRAEFLTRVARSRFPTMFTKITRAARGLGS